MAKTTTQGAQPWRSEDNPLAGGETVTVCSKLPMDFMLRLHRKVTKHEPVMGGGMRAYDVFEPRFDVPVVVVRGCSYPQNKGPAGQIEGGYALTPEVPKAFWEEWLSQNEQADIIKNGMLFAQNDLRSAVAQAREQGELKSNLERLDPNNLPKGLETADVRKAA